MQAANDIQTELAELDSRLADLPKRLPYQVPAAYFHELPAALAEAARAADIPEQRPQWGETPAFSVPAGYFDDLAQQLAGEVVNAPAALPYSVPDGYLQQLPDQLLAGVKAAGNQPPAQKTRPFRPAVRRLAPWLAAAAVMAGIWFGVGRVPAVSPEAAAGSALSALERDSIGVYVELHADEFDAESLEEALAAGPVADLRDEVSQLPESEIEAYLNDADAEAGASNGS